MIKSRSRYYIGKKEKEKTRETSNRSYKECESICATRKMYDFNCHGCKYYQTKECLKMQGFN